MQSDHPLNIMCYDTSREMHQGKMSQTWQHTMPLCPHVSHRTMNAREVTKIGYQLFKENPIETHYGLGFGVLGYENFFIKTCEKWGVYM